MITYLINFILCSGLLLLVYRSFLGAENLYRFNRFYLLFSLVFSLLVPAITIHVPYIKNLDWDKFFTATHQAMKPQTVLSNKPQAPAFNHVNVYDRINEQALTQYDDMPMVNAPVPGKITPKPQRVHYSLKEMLLALYGAGVLLLLGRFVRNACRITRLISKNKTIEYQDAKLVLVTDDVTPHSFLKYIFLNKQAYDHQTIEPEIICHEQAHVRQLHSLDVIWVELFQIVCWFNPFIPFYRKAIQLNHEFLADEAVIENYQDTPAYQYLLLAKASQSGSLYLTSQFNYLVTKKRIMMMTKRTTVAIALYKRLILLPVLGLALFLFSQKMMAQSTPKSGDKQAKKTTAKTPLGEQDAPQSVLDEYAKILAKYHIPYKKEDKINYTPDFSPADKQRLAVLYKQMSNDQRQHQYVRLLPVDRVVFLIKDKDLINWQDKTRYNVFIDDKEVDNANLSKFKVSDFAGALSGNLGEHSSRVKVELMTRAYYKQHLKDRIQSGFIYIPKEKWKDVNWQIGGAVPPKPKVQPIPGRQTVESAPQDAPQSIIASYAAILKKYNFPPDTAKLKEVLTPPYPKHKLLGTPAFSKEDKAQLLSLFKQMSRNQQEAQWVIFVKVPRVLPKTLPTAAQLNDWKNPVVYGVWVDGKKVNNAELANYKATDFDWSAVSKLYGAALQGKSYRYQVDLMTKPYYAQYVNKAKAVDPYVAFAHVPGINKVVSVHPTLNKSGAVINQQQPLIVIDGKISDQSVPAQFNFATASNEDYARWLSLSPHDITTISILKDQAASSLWGERGANGVLLITTKKRNSSGIRSDLQRVSTTGRKGTPVPLIVVDGKVIDKKMPPDLAIYEHDNKWYADLLAIAPADIKTVSILKDSTAIALWGPKAANGVLMITTK